jgi:DNA polymerase
LESYFVPVSGIKQGFSNKEKNIMLEKITQNIEEYIKYCKDNGITRAEISQETLKEIPNVPFALGEEKLSVQPQARSIQPQNNQSFSLEKPKAPTFNAAPQSNNSQQFETKPIASPTPYDNQQDNPPQEAQKPFVFDTNLYANAEDGIKDIIRMVSECRMCPLAEQRDNTVPGEGSTSPEIMFIGEGPGADEDATGTPFVGKAGKLLFKMFEKLNLSRDDIYISNIVKCHPPNNRKPTAEEIAACLPYLKAQIELLKPKVIVALGGTAVNSLFDSAYKITKQRGIWMEYNGIPLMPTYHPSYLLRAPQKRWDTWNDMIEIFKKIDKPLPEGIK